MFAMGNTPLALQGAERGMFFSNSPSFPKSCRKVIGTESLDLILSSGK